MGEELNKILGDAVEIDAANYTGHNNGAGMGTALFHVNEIFVLPQSSR